MKTDKQIEKTVIKYFISVIKEHGHYPLFLANFPNYFFGRIFAKTIKPLCHFSECHNLDDIIKLLRSNNPMQLDDKNKFDYVTSCVNNLLHSFIESRNIPMRSLCLMGEEIYDMSCKSLFGDNFKEENDDEIGNLTDLMQVKSKLIQSYFNGIKLGKFNFSFGEYLYAVRKNDIVKWVDNNIVDDKKGKVIAFLMDNRLPDENGGIPFDDENCDSTDEKTTWCSMPF